MNPQGKRENLFPLDREAPFCLEKNALPSMWVLCAFYMPSMWVVSGWSQNQRMEFNMSINNPALTGQVLVNVARASMRLQPGCYTMVEIPVIDMLPGEREGLIGHLV